MSRVTHPVFSHVIRPPFDPRVRTAGTGRVASLHSVCVVSHCCETDNFGGRVKTRGPHLRPHVHSCLNLADIVCACQVAGSKFSLRLSKHMFAECVNIV